MILLRTILNFETGIHSTHGNINKNVFVFGIGIGIQATGLRMFRSVLGSRSFRPGLSLSNPAATNSAIVRHMKEMEMLIHLPHLSPNRLRIEGVLFADNTQADDFADYGELAPLLPESGGGFQKTIRGSEMSRTHGCALSCQPAATSKEIFKRIKCQAGRSCLGSITGNLGWRWPAEAQRKLMRMNRNKIACVNGIDSQQAPRNEIQTRSQQFCRSMFTGRTHGRPGCASPFGTG